MKITYNKLVRDLIPQIIEKSGKTAVYDTLSDEAYLEKIIQILGVEERLGHLPSAMSGGQQQRIAIARALANKPSILFADEPTGNLDGKSGREVLSLLKYVGKELGITLIMVTHDLQVAEQAQRILRIEDGKIVKDSAKEAGDR